MLTRVHYFCGEVLLLFERTTHGGAITNRLEGALQNKKVTTEKGGNAHIKLRTKKLFLIQKLLEELSSKDRFRVETHIENLMKAGNGPFESFIDFGGSTIHQPTGLDQPD